MHLTSAVTVTLDANLNFPFSQTCTSLPPGVCCRARTFPDHCYYNPFNPNLVHFSALLPTDIAIVWGPRHSNDNSHSIIDCSGVPLETRTGVTGTWTYSNGGQNVRPYGASYLRLPLGTEGESQWLAAEGMLGLVWGGGSWFAKGFTGVGGGGLRRRQGEKWTAYAIGPREWRWPDQVTVNGTRYAGHAGEYWSEGGEVLNSTMAC